MKYCIVTIIDGEIANYYKEISTDVSRKFSVRNISERIPCHITLKYPFEADEYSIRKTGDKLKKIVASKKPFDFQVNGLDEFDQKTIFFSVEKNLKFVDYFRSCVQELGEFDEDRKYSLADLRPHISVVRYLTPLIFTESWNYIANLNLPPLTGSFDNISILVKENDIWKVKEVFSFKNN